jgi:hypothetical protein
VKPWEYVAGIVLTCLLVYVLIVWLIWYLAGGDPDLSEGSTEDQDEAE